MRETYYIGWDVGGWNCKAHKNKSCDALVVLDANNIVLGDCRETLTPIINKVKNTKEFTNKLLELCGVKIPNTNYKVILAIDTPLGFSSAFKKLICNYTVSNSSIETHISNPYLFRKTEQFIYNTLNKKPLSAVNDMIGSQATKGIHVVSKFAPEIKQIGVWCNNLKTEDLVIIETYPAVVDCVEKLTSKDKDIQDAYKCAYIASLFYNINEKLWQPNLKDEIELLEGWIWFNKKNKSYD